jgi:hypothetical protein
MCQASSTNAGMLAFAAMPTRSGARTANAQPCDVDVVEPQMRKLMSYRRIKGRPVAVQKRDEPAPFSAAPVGDVLRVLAAPGLVDTREDVPPSRSDLDPVDRLPDHVQSRIPDALRRLYVTGDTDPAVTPHRNANLQGRRGGSNAALGTARQAGPRKRVRSPLCARSRPADGLPPAPTPAAGDG